MHSEELSLREFLEDTQERPTKIFWIALCRVVLEQPDNVRLTRGEIERQHQPLSEHFSGKEQTH